jgi:glycosyltransferase involved in cell wall biosynthesis
MKEILDIFKSSSDPQFIEQQFNYSHDNKNVLFINPKISGRHFYKYILPYITMYSFDVWSTAITGMYEYNHLDEYSVEKTALGSKQILWADYIVFPFITEPLSDLYHQLKRINPDVKIIYNVDFNYYLMSKNHPLYDRFKDESVHRSIEDNIMNSDITMTTNVKLTEYLIDKFEKEIIPTGRYEENDHRTIFKVFPLLLDEPLILENIEIQLPPFENPTDSLRVGIIATDYYWEDIAAYKDQIKEIHEKLGSKVKFVLIGFDGKDRNGKTCIPDGLDLEVIKPCTIIHYFKQLRNLRLDLLFIPLRQNEYNITSENYNKFLEAGFFDIPVMTYNIFPYNNLITNGHNGIILNKKNDMVERITFFEQNRLELKRMGKAAHQHVIDNFMMEGENIYFVDSIYTDQPLEMEDPEPNNE